MNYCKHTISYLCDECNWSGTVNEMKNESDLDYNQDCCHKCNNVMFDNRFGRAYCKSIDEVRDDKINSILK